MPDSLDEQQGVNDSFDHEITSCLKLEKLFGSKTKTDILKYLVFRRQGISMRAFETELSRSFPAIKKQIEQLEGSGIVSINRAKTTGWEVSLAMGFDRYMRDFLVFALSTDLHLYFSDLHGGVWKYFLGKLFGYENEIDLAVIYDDAHMDYLDDTKQKITQIFGIYLIQRVNVTFMSKDDFEKRYRLTDKFVLNLMRLSDERVV